MSHCFSYSQSPAQCLIHSGLHGVSGLLFEGKKDLKSRTSLDVLEMIAHSFITCSSFHQIRMKCQMICWSLG